MAVSAKRWTQAGKTIDRRARAYMSREGVSYSEAVGAILRKDRKLWAAYHRAPEADTTARSLAKLEDLAKFLNDHEKHPLKAALQAFKHKDATNQDVALARPVLEAGLSRLRVEFTPFFVDRSFTVGTLYPGGHYGTIVEAVNEGTFSALHCCRWCNRFFVHKDHRRDYCTVRCFKKRETYRVKLWRVKRYG
jgi:hypothetical protein